MTRQHTARQRFRWLLYICRQRGIRRKMSLWLHNKQSPAFRKHPESYLW